MQNLSGLWRMTRQMDVQSKVQIGVVICLAATLGLRRIRVELCGGDLVPCFHQG